MLNSLSAVFNVLIFLMSTSSWSPSAEPYPILRQSNDMTVVRSNHIPTYTTSIRIRGGGKGPGPGRRTKPKKARNYPDLAVSLALLLAAKALYNRLRIFPTSQPQSVLTSPPAAFSSRPPHVHIPSSPTSFHSPPTRTLAALSRDLDITTRISRDRPTPPPAPPAAGP